MARSPVSVFNSSCTDFFSLWTHASLPLSEAFNHVYYNNLSLSPSPYDHDADFSRILTPYSADTFNLFLCQANLSHEFPELPFKLRHGFSLGKFLPLTQSYTPDNLPGAYKFQSVIEEYIVGELQVGRFSGPFSKGTLESKIGPFRSSPLQVAIKKGIDGAPDKHRVCSTPFV
jgi:hypothetical protein